MSGDLYAKIQQNQKTPETAFSEEKTVTWLVFSAGKDTFALEPGQVQEIVRNTELYPLPFVPPYIKGVLNRHGDPYAVIDIASFFGHEDLSENLFLILNDGNDIALRISEIREFYTTGEAGLQKLSDAVQSDFFLRSGQIQQYNGFCSQCDRDNR